MSPGVVPCEEYVAYMPTCTGRIKAVEAYRIEARLNLMMPITVYSYYRTHGDRAVSLVCVLHASILT